MGFWLLGYVKGGFNGVKICYWCWLVSGWGVSIASTKQTEK